jgi:hypothetical protein
MHDNRKYTVRIQQRVLSSFYCGLLFSGCQGNGLNLFVLLSFCAACGTAPQRISPHPLFHYFLDSQAKHRGHCRVYKGDKLEYSRIQQQTTAKITV